MAATLTTGLLAGLLFAYACSVMPGLRRTGDRTLVEVMQHINRAIMNGWFLAVLLGSALTTSLAVLLQLPGDASPALLPAVAALVLLLAAIGVTGAVNVPLNNALEAAGPPGRITDPAAVRAQFERPWVRANLVRTVLCTASLGCLGWALAVH
ncbi:DUF1772 domain-containing protein [Streptomyces sp. ACA25]|uniref:anthrone oxygenase family protein n=1 Tax=Streptomyces sp. ACA25 TaxID=3022596 RepID=UPI0023080077|nr:DUF1772 domain-containing protein [Streptomyces sp. ACA25]MDB1087677.1 DUF1772 domain-containing protein [Streptomyces sp. ACA25]